MREYNGYDIGAVKVEQKATIDRRVRDALKGALADALMALGKGEPAYQPAYGETTFQRLQQTLTDFIDLGKMEGRH